MPGNDLNEYNADLRRSTKFSMLTIRSYKESDREKVIEIFRMNIPVYFHPDELGNLLTYLELHGNSYYVLLEDDQIVGSGGYHLMRSEAIGRISWDFIHTDWQGMGLGRQLVSHCLDQLQKNHNVKKIVVMTSQHAFHFYEKFGFHLREIRNNYWGSGLHLYAMEMEN